MKNKILIKRGYLISLQGEDKAPNYASYLLYKFGVEVDKPQLLNKENVNTISKFYGTNIPKGFYDNPQDLKYFTCEELILEQLVSYFKIAINGTTSDNKEVFDRVELFKKALPHYTEGDEVVLRQYKIINNDEADAILSQIMADYCSYTRPWSNDETAEVEWLYINGYYNNHHVGCKDNAIAMFLNYKTDVFAKMLDLKDVVKLSVEMKNEVKNNLKYTTSEQTILQCALKNAYRCPLSKKQAKYLNTIAKKIGVKIDKASNKQSPYRLAKQYIDKGNVLEAAKAFATNGSLLERNLVWLLSRADANECQQIVDMIKYDNPIVLYQLLQGIIEDNYSEPRTFSFYKNKLLKNHQETEYEHKYRKSILSIGTKSMLNNILIDKIRQAYENKPKLGNIYISEEFKNIPLPTNTSSTGSGLDVMPAGSRLKITDDYIRAFCYWNDAFDIDTSSIMANEDFSKQDVLFFGNYSQKAFGNSALCSGDDRGYNGAEYQDFRLSELAELGYKYVIYVLNGYGSPLNHGNIYCGYQNKSDLDTKAWSAKNMAIKINVKGNSRQYYGFAIDLESREIIILNQIIDSNQRVISTKDIGTIKKYLSKDYLQVFNMYELLCCRGTLVDNPEDADVVFDRDYIAKENQTAIKPYEIEKLVSLLN